MEPTPFRAPVEVASAGGRGAAEEGPIRAPVDAKQPGPRRKRRVAALVVVLVVAGLATASLGFLAGRYVSPNQLAAEASPPPPAVVTYAVERAALRSELIGRGQVVRPGGVDLQPQARAEHVVVTKVGFAVGDEVGSASLLCEISGEPVVLFQGAFAPYRDLRVGDQGGDVDMLRAAVAAAGYGAGAEGRFDSALLEGVSRLYHDLGYELPQAVPEEATAGGGQGAAESRPAAPFLPREWWLTAPVLPAVATASSIAVGSGGGGEAASVTLSLGAPHLQVAFPDELTQAIPENAAVRFEATDGEPIECQAGQLDRTEGEDSVVLISCSAGELDDVDLGASGRVVVTLAQAEDSLVVPISAITVDKAGGPAVRKTSADTAGGGTAASSLVSVTLGLEVDGMVQVEADSLAEGDLVVLGSG
jgi:hypothetical protein